jgi:hypothetical protein
MKKQEQKYPALVRMRMITKDAIKSLGRKGETYDDVLSSIPEIKKAIEKLER